MSTVTEQERELVEYLLGRLAPEEQARIEDRYDAFEALHEDLLATGDELIHAYLLGSLPPEDRRQFETHFLASPRRRERLEFMRSLLDAVDRAAAPAAARRPPRSALATGLRWGTWAAVLLVGITALVVPRRPPAPSVHQAAMSPAPPAPRPRPPAPASVDAAPPAEPPASRRHAARPVQRVRVPRDATAPVEIELPSADGAVRLEVDVDGAHPSYDVRLETAEGVPTWKAEGLTVSEPGAPLVVMVAANLLTSDRMVLSVDGETLRAPRSSAKYTLRVVRRGSGPAPPPPR